jgi:hypothetical protein
MSLIFGNGKKSAVFFGVVSPTGKMFEYIIFSMMHHLGERGWDGQMFDKYKKAI